MGVRRTLINIFIITLSAAFLAACGDAAKLPEEVSIGPNPVIPAPYTSYIPTVNIAPAKGWPAGGKPKAAAGLLVNEFAKGLEHPRWLIVLPNGDVLVAESDGPKRPEDGKRMDLSDCAEVGRLQYTKRRPNHVAA